MQCSKPIRIYPNHISYPDGLLVPCGKCLSCKIAKSREWSVRLCHELETNRDAVFATFTYSPESLVKRCLLRGVPCHSLEREFLRKFWKRFRKANPDVRIKYFCCGEYGEKKARPHYHAIIFGLKFWEHDVSMAQPDRGRVLSGMLTDVWREGNVHLGTVTYNSSHYVAKYIDKFIFDKVEMRRRFEDFGRERPFRLSSLGLGRDFALKNKDQILRDGITMRGVNMGIPRYYQRILGADSLLLIARARERATNQILEWLKKGWIRKYEYDLWFSRPVWDISDFYNRIKAVPRMRAQKELNISAKLRNKSSCKL